ncbi:MAG: AP2 domain-containing protein [Hyphomonadaceae bacterium]|nr:AP2 domain-containing protein [Hyphomonadaceae bacterium]
MGKATRDRHICRVEYAARAESYWIVRIIKRGKTVSRMFSDSVYGGKRKSLTAARAWRDATLDPSTEVERAAHRRLVVRRNTRSGIPGVARYDHETARHPFWIAYWDEPGGGRRSAKFSTKVHGEHGARDLAIEARRTALLRLGFGEELVAVPWVTTGAASIAKRRRSRNAG